MYNDMQMLDHSPKFTNGTVRWPPVTTSVPEFPTFDKWPQCNGTVIVILVILTMLLKKQKHDIDHIQRDYLSLECYQAKFQDEDSEYFSHTKVDKILDKSRTAPAGWNHHLNYTSHLWRICNIYICIYIYICDRHTCAPKLNTIQHQLKHMIIHNSSYTPCKMNPLNYEGILQSGNPYRVHSPRTKHLQASSGGCRSQCSCWHDPRSNTCAWHVQDPQKTFQDWHTMVGSLP